ncbi:hypothetical protein QQ045_012634 [Rhodiola kirilowii]
MVDDDEERDLEVRSLTGESTVVSISVNQTVEDLKEVLKQKFKPASEYPNFHLYFKGTKLNLKTRLDYQAISRGSFIVIIPFIMKGTKKAQQCSDPVVEREQGVENRSSVNIADLAWQDIMNDVSDLRDISNSANDHSSEIRNPGSGVTGVGCSTFSGEKTCISEEEIRDDLIVSILQSHNESGLLGENCITLVKVLEMVGCLSDQESGECLLYRKSRILNHCESLSNKNDICSCVCPSWLKAVLKAFTFLNIVSANLQQQGQDTTWDFLTEVLVHLENSGLLIGLENLDALSLLCPKVVCLVDQEGEVKPDKIKIILLKGSHIEGEQNGRAETKTKRARRHTPISKIFDTLKTREKYFKTSLSTLVKSLMERGSKNGLITLSLDDLCKFVNEGDKHKSVQINNSTKRKRSSSCRRPYCCDVQLLSASQMIDHLRHGMGSEGQIKHVETIAARKANYVNIPEELSGNINSAIQRLGIEKLYSHQAESIKSSLAGNSVVVATMTSSGKSLCYNLPVLETLSTDLSSCALYIFPTKALAQDQLRAIMSVTEGLDVGLNVGIYDGDTSQAERQRLRDHSRLLITNPDMLHVSILPHHHQFKRILSNLRFVVIDEAHAYKGAFGCHTALILRRLCRLCSHVYGTGPSFVLCTATLANPHDHAMELSNLESLHVVQNDGSPSGEKLFILWDPSQHPKVKLDETGESTGTSRSMDQNEETRPSSILEVSRLFAEMVQHGLRSIAFCKSRKLCELVLYYTREILEQISAELADSICSYRGGYTAEDRRRIESDFFGGKLCGIAATNALELGIDVGHIDVTLHLGFPGSIASLWQQAGRAGRRGNPSLAVYVSFQDPLDQYFMKHPWKLFGSPIECCHVDSQNEQVMVQHLACAALEHPLHSHYDGKYFGSGMNRGIMLLKEKGYVACDPSRHSSARIWTYIGREKKPSQAVSIRAIETEKYKVMDKQRGEVLEEIEESRAFFQVYEGAVYMNQGMTYLVTDLDITSKIAWCQRADLKYFTQPRSYTDIHVIGGETAYPANAMQSRLLKTTAQAGKCKVTTTWFAFNQVSKGRNVVIDRKELSLPTFSFESQAAWIRVPQSIKIEVDDFRGGLHAACHAVLSVVPLFVVCNLSDLAPECANPHDERYFPERILLYDQHPGGTGLAAQIQPIFTDLLNAALELLMACSCSSEVGCPYCVQSLACHEYNEVLHKESAIKIIKIDVAAGCERMAVEEGDKAQSEFEKDQCKPLIDLDLSDFTELWLIQWPYKQDLDFDGQEVSLKLTEDGSLGNFTGASGKEYEVASFKSLDADATVFVSSASESKVVGKISRRVSFVHYPDSVELSMYDPDKVKEERDKELYGRTLRHSSSRSGPSMSRSTYMTTQNGWSKQTNSSHGSRKRSAVSQVDTPSRSSRKIQSLGSADRSTQDSKRANSGLTNSGGSSGNISKVKQEQE